jgi:hypothetical protein
MRITITMCSEDNESSLVWDWVDIHTFLQKFPGFTFLGPSILFLEVDNRLSYRVPLSDWSPTPPRISSRWLGLVLLFL